jgi:hypothetical protein
VAERRPLWVEEARVFLGIARADDAASALLLITLKSRNFRQPVAKSENWASQEQEPHAHNFPAIRHGSLSFLKTS